MAFTMDFKEFTELMLKHYKNENVKSLRINRVKPKYEQMLLFNELYHIPFEFWADVRGSLTGKKGNKRPRKKSFFTEKLITKELKRLELKQENNEALSEFEIKLLEFLQSQGKANE